jgi:hypothetical protein
MFGSICTGGFAARPTFVGRTFNESISGAIFLAAKAKLTSLKVEAGALKTARH